MLVLYVKWAKSDQSFLTKWTLFLNFYMLFPWIFICRLCRDYKKVKTKISFSYQYSQAFWWTNYSVMWHCNLHPCFGDRSLLHVFCLQHYFHLLLLFSLLLFFSSNLFSPSSNVCSKRAKKTNFLLLKQVKSSAILKSQSKQLNLVPRSTWLTVQLSTTLLHFWHHRSN